MIHIRKRNRDQEVIIHNLTQMKPDKQKKSATRDTRAIEKEEIGVLYIQKERTTVLLMFYTHYYNDHFKRILES
jgi:hypothetical protein